MDDALVNFDDQRAQAASRTLVEFMNDRNGDHQMLVLTCHAHVAALFQAAKATVRTLGTKQLIDSQLAPTDTLTQQSWRAEEFFFGDNE
jgi:deoxycytidylate deaminase